MSSDFKAVRDAKTVLLTTYKRDGTPVETPVSIAFEGDRAFFRSYHQAWKTRRLRNNPEVEVAASTLRGKRTDKPGQRGRPPWRGCCWAQWMDGTGQPLCGAAAQSWHLGRLCPSGGG